MHNNFDRGDTYQTAADSGSISPKAPITDSFLPQTADAVSPTTEPAGVATEQNTEAAAAGVETDADDCAARFHELWEIIKSCTAPTIRSHKWRFLGEPDELLRIDMQSAEFVAALEQDFAAESLVKWGLYERVGEELRLPSWLDGDAYLYVAIDKTNKTIKFSCGDHFLFPMTRNALDLALERIAPDSTHASSTLFIADSEDAVEVLQRLGLPAVSGESLEALGQHDVERLFSGDLRSDFGWRYYLLLVDFDVARLDNRPTATIGEVIKRLADAADVYGIDPDRRFGVSRPSAHEFHLLERAITFKDSGKICQLFEKWSAAAKSIIIINWRTHFDEKAASFSVAKAALTRALQKSSDIARRAEVLDALPAYRLALSGTVIPKLHEDIDRAIDPFQQLDLIAAADYAEAFFNSDPLVVAGEAVLQGQTPPCVRELEVESWQERQRLLNELRRIHRDHKAKR